MATTRGVLRLVSADRPGLVADVSGLLFRLGANLVHADQHTDLEANTFFQRIEFTVAENGAAARSHLGSEIGRACERWGMRWLLRFPEYSRRRVAVLASKRGHCPLDLLARHHAGELDCDIAFVLSNHGDLETEVTRRGYRFIHAPMLNGDKPAQERVLQDHLNNEGVELVVLARYMQILSADWVRAWTERVINIHHSFLPAFAGAEPYRQAHRRGVKLIGATSHYVTAELDQGPIIAQDVVQVTHRDDVADMERKGRDIERVVLAHAVRCHLEDRVIAYGNKTVVFE